MLPLGTIRAIALEPAPRWPVELRNTRHLHGAISARLTGHVASSRVTFRLLPWQAPSGWAIQALAPERGLEKGRYKINLWREERDLVLGPMVCPRVPAFQAFDGQRLIELETRTPVAMKENGRELGRGQTEPVAEVMLSSLRGHAQRLGLELPAPGVLSVVAKSIEPIVLEIGGRWRGRLPGADQGRVVGWEGKVALLVDDASHWLLRVAHVYGLGGRISLGFGAVVVRELRP